MKLQWQVNGTSLIGCKLVPGMGWCYLIKQDMPGELETILSEIEHALGHGLWYLALAVALSIPDVCSLLEREEGVDDWPKEAKFANWYDRYMGYLYNGFTGQDCFRVRGGVLHKGQFGHPKARYDRILFSIPPSMPISNFKTWAVGHENENALTMDLPQFCHAMIAAARKWNVDHRDDPTVKTNLEKIVRYRPEGLAPHVVGTPVVA